MSHGTKRISRGWVVGTGLLLITCSSHSTPVSEFVGWDDPQANPSIRKTATIRTYDTGITTSATIPAGANALRICIAPTAKIGWENCNQSPPKNSQPIRGTLQDTITAYVTKYPTETHAVDNHFLGNPEYCLVLSFVNAKNDIYAKSLGPIPGAICTPVPSYNNRCTSGSKVLDYVFSGTPSSINGMNQTRDLGVSCEQPGVLKFKSGGNAQVSSSLTANLSIGGQSLNDWVTIRTSDVDTNVPVTVTLRGTAEPGVYIGTTVLIMTWE